jgi:hypothetical protein
MPRPSVKVDAGTPKSRIPKSRRTPSRVVLAGSRGPHDHIAVHSIKPLHHRRPPNVDRCQTGSRRNQSRNSQRRCQTARRNTAWRIIQRRCPFTPNLSPRNTGAFPITSDVQTLHKKRRNLQKVEGISGVRFVPICPENNRRSVRTYEIQNRVCQGSVPRPLRHPARGRPSAAIRGHRPSTPRDPDRPQTQIHRSLAVHSQHLCWKKTAESSESRRLLGGGLLPPRAAPRLPSAAEEQIRYESENVNRRDGACALISIVSPELLGDLI